MDKIAIYPGSFDPITCGHIDLIQRGKKIFTTLIIAIGENSAKRSLFSLEERLSMVKEATRGMPDVEVTTLTSLITSFAEERDAHVLLRGVRAFSDFDYEFQMALMNRKISPDIETVFMIPDESYSYISSRIVKEVARYGGSIAGLVPDFVATRLWAKLGKVEHQHD